MAYKRLVKTIAKATEAKAGRESARPSLSPAFELRICIRKAVQAAVNANE